jgi:hypothetical protein
MKLCRINNIKLYRIIVKNPIKHIKLYKVLKIKLNNIHPNIHYNFLVFPKKNWTRTMTELEEEEEEADCSRNHTAKKGAHTCHPSVILCPWWSSGVVHNPLRVAYIAGWDQLRVARPRSPQTGCSILIGSSQWSPEN